MNKQAKAIVYAIAATISFAPFAGADISGATISASHQAVTPNKKAVARCIKVIQKYWNRQEKLVLDKRARLRNTDTELVLFVNGWIWERGQRVEKHHQCTTNRATQQVALHVGRLNQPLISKH